jgi:plastocyanin
VSAVRAAALLAAALALGACGEDRGDSVSTETAVATPRPARADKPQAAPPAEVSVSEDEYLLEPARIRVDRPATLAITVRNRGRRGHALAVGTPAGERRTRTLARGESARLTVELDEPGRYRWYCPVPGHARRGMRGSIAVAKEGG